MSLENVEVVLEATRRFAARDWDGYAELLDPDIKMTAAEGWPEPGPFTGRDVVIAQYEGVTGVWGEQGVAGLEVVADDGDWVVVEYRLHARGEGSGIATDFQVATATRLSGERIIETHWRWDRADALEAAGLSE